MINDISQLDLDKHYTYADYLAWQFRERVELIKGKIFKMSPAPGTDHQKIVFKLSMAMGNNLNDQNCEVYISPFDVRLPIKDEKGNPNTVIQPDICVICDLTKLDSKGCNGAPDLIVEIVSKSSVKKDLHEKFDLYQEARVQEYWVVQPANTTINVFTLNEDGVYDILRPKTYGDQISSTILPGLTIDLDEIFSNLLEEPDEGYGDEVQRL